MDKKARGTQASAAASKGAVAEGKGKQDLGGTKLFPKTGHGRESGSSLRLRADPGRNKPTPQKSKALDKRPRPRGQYNSEHKNCGQVAEPEEPEFGSVLVPGTKKPNLNHLLNFYFVPRDGVQYKNHNWRGGGNHRGVRGRGINGFFVSHTSHRPKYNKEQYLQANCQFVVKYGCDYSVYNCDPDLLVQWDLIEDIRLRCLEMPSCPICLYPPVCAKMTRCGHVYCWPCILHYLSLSDEGWRACPICFEITTKQELKSVVPVPSRPVVVKQEVKLRLMCRDRDSLVPVWVGKAQDGRKQRSIPMTVGDEVDEAVHCKLLTATQDEVKYMVLSREREELQAKLHEEGDCPESCFIEEALDLLAQRERELSGKTNGGEGSNGKIGGSGAEKEGDKKVEENGIHIEEADEVGELANRIVYKSAYDDEVDDKSASESEFGSPTPGRTRNESTDSEGNHSDDALDASIVTLTAEDLEVTPGEAELSHSPSQTSTKRACHYFYQSADGQPVFMHSLNIQMLAAQYGSLELCPTEITASVVEVDSASLTEELRSRLRHLRHLPLASPLEVVEVEMGPPLVSRATLQLFRQRMEERRQRRQRRARDERRREKRIAEEEGRKWGKFPSAQIKIDSRRQFPDSFENQSPANSNLMPPSTAYVETPSIDPSVVEAATITHVEPSFPSFAQMLREGKCKPATPRPVTTSTNATKLRPQHSDSESEDHVPVPEYHHSFGEAIASALEKADDRENAGGNSGKKKKKQKAKVLFTTSKVFTAK